MKRLLDGLNAAGGRPAKLDVSRLAIAMPSPATHAIFTKLKAGESVLPTLLLTETVFHALRGAQPLFHAIFGVKTLSVTLLGPALNVERVTGLAAGLLAGAGGELARRHLAGALRAASSRCAAWRGLIPNCEGVGGATPQRHQPGSLEYNGSISELCCA